MVISKTHQTLLDIVRIKINCSTSKVSCHERSVRIDDCQQSNSPSAEAMQYLLLPPSLPPNPSQDPPSSLPLPPSQEHAASLSPGRALCSSSSSASAPPLDCFPPPRSPFSLVFLACNNNSTKVPDARFNNSTWRVVAVWADLQGCYSCSFFCFLIKVGAPSLETSSFVPGPQLFCRCDHFITLPPIQPLKVAPLHWIG